MEPGDAIGGERPALRRWEAAILGELNHPSTPLAALLVFAMLAAMTFVLAGFEVARAVDSVQLSRRGEIAVATVRWANDDAPTARVTFDTPSGRIEALLDPVAEDALVGERIPVVYDPEHPDTARDARRPIWAWRDLVPSAPLLVFFGLMAYLDYRWWRWLLHRRGGEHRG